LNQPLVSVIIPAYNAGAYLKQTIDSVIAQTWPKLEIIVVNDGSTDDTATVLSGFKTDLLQVIDNDKKGASAARNKGLQAVSGDYIQFLDADDLLSPDKIEGQMQRLLESNSANISLCKTVQFFDDEDYRDKHPDYNWYYHDHNNVVDFLIKLYAGEDTMPGYGGFVQPNAWLTPRVVIEKAGGWDESLTTDDDGEFFCRIVLAADGIRFSDKGLNYYRKHRREHSLSGQKTLAGFESRLKATDLKYQHIKAKSDNPLIDKIFARFYWWLGVEAYPQYKTLSRICIDNGKKMGYSGKKYVGGANGHLITKLLGWRASRLISYYKHKK